MPNLATNSTVVQSVLFCVIVLYSKISDNPMSAFPC